MRKIVVKIGSSTIVTIDRKFNFKVAEVLAEDIVKLKKQEIEILLVSSGAIALGRHGNCELDKRLASSKGQLRLMDGWRKVFAVHGIDACQILINNGCHVDFNSFRAPNMQIVINGNDVFESTNNDLVASKVAKAASADLLVLLTGVDGYLDNHGNRIAAIDINTARLNDHSTVSEFGTGGIETKIQAIKEAAILAVIANGEEHAIISRILAGEDVGTLFKRGFDSTSKDS